jgi:hypothetical protein
MPAADAGLERLQAHLSELEEAHHLAVNATFIPTGGSGTEPTKVGTALCAIFGSLKG